MDYETIARIADPKTARNLQDDDYFNDHIAGCGKDIDGEKLDALIRGAVILGVDPVDYPLTDGLYIYMKLPAGEVMALLIESRKQGGDYEALKISGAAIE